MFGSSIIKLQEKLDYMVSFILHNNALWYKIVVFDKFSRIIKESR